MIRILIASAAFLAAILQSWKIITTGKEICFNDGCSIVERLTTVPTLYFYLCAALFFLLIALFSLFSLYGNSERKEYIEKYIHLLLSAACAMEGVLVFFQYAVAHTFCSACLIVLAIIFLLNCLSGREQFLRGAACFIAVITACFALQFNNNDAKSTHPSLDKGTMAHYREEGNSGDMTLIFSKDCPHCEQVIDFLKEESFCNISFNPYGQMEPASFIFDGATITAEYNAAATKNFMTSLNLHSFPILIANRNKSNIQILQGSTAIITYLQAHCRIAETTETTEKEENKTKSNNGQTTILQQHDFLLPHSSQSDRCNESSPCL